MKDDDLSEARKEYTFQIHEKYPRMTILHHLDADGTLWGTEKRWICKNQHGKWEKVAQFPFQSPRDWFGFSRPTARAMRADKCNLYVNQFGRILGIRAGQVYAISEGEQPQALFTIQGDSVLHGSLCEDDQGNILFGEYFMNPSRGAVNLWRVSADLDAWEPAVAFTEEKIRHIHGVFRDPYQQGVFWVAVGDFAGECYLLRSADNFKTMEKYGDGSQIWRAVHLFFTSDHVCWLTDSNLEPNHACRMERTTGALEIGMDIANSGWYGTTTEEGLHVAFTTVERGPGITSNYSEVLISQDGFNWQSIHSFKKDWYRPVQVFKYGVISCPSGTMSKDNLYISGEGLVGLDGCSMRIGIAEK